ncbi:MAG: tetratricopeptide repeat protein [Gammaproteobacteria bacterium]
MSVVVRIQAGATGVALGGLGPGALASVTAAERTVDERALDLLRGARVPADDGGEYLGFIAALEQRLGQHAEAIESYRAALGASPRRGQWWIGLAISLAAAGRPDEADGAFRRALEDRQLSDRLRGYANRELVRLSGSS